MPLAVTHVLVPIIFFELLRNHFPKISKLFPRKYTFLIGIAGLLPDIDSPVYSVLTALGKNISNCCLEHRIILHNIWLPASFLAFFFLFYYLYPKLLLEPKRTRTKTNMRTRKSDIERFKSFGKVFLILFAGFSIHLILDAVLTGHIAPLYPLSMQIVNFDLVGKLEYMTKIPGLTILVSLDALLLLFWLWHEEFTHKIVDYF
jgi:membrane-bound metal-dependent hydrolase YbcI (DUF457 family)